MKAMKRTLLLTFTFLFLFSSISFASSPNVSELDDSKVVLVLNGTSYSTTKSEALRILEGYYKDREPSIENHDPEVKPYVTTQWDEYVILASYHMFDTSQKVAVTPWVRANYPGTEINHINSVTVTSSFSGNLTSPEIGVIAAKVGVEYQRSASTGDSFGQTFTVPTGKKGRVVFTPSVLYTSGNLNHYIMGDWELEPRVSSKSIYAKFLLTAGKYADGIYELEVTEAY